MPPARDRDGNRRPERVSYVCPGCGLSVKGKDVERLIDAVHPDGTEGKAVIYDTPYCVNCEYELLRVEQIIYADWVGRGGGLALINTRSVADAPLVKRAPEIRKGV